MVTGENTITIKNSDNTQSQSYTIDLGTTELCKIRDYQDYIYRNGGKWFKHKEIEKITIDSTGNWAMWTDSFSATSAFYKVFSQIIDVGNVADFNLFCNYFTPKTSLTVDTVGVQHTVKNLIFRTNVDILTEDSIDGWKNWLNNHNLLVYAPLATPTDTEITDTTLINQLEAVKLLSGTQNNFTIDADILPTLNLNYIGEANPHL